MKLRQKNIIYLILGIFLVALGNKGFFYSLIDEWTERRNLKRQRELDVLADKIFETQKLVYDEETKKLVNSHFYFPSLRINRFNFEIKDRVKIESGNVAEDAGESN